MAEFLKGSQLNAQLEDLFENAEQQLIIISPFIKLHSRFKDALKPKKDDPNMHVVIVFGKNEDDIAKSFNQDDFNFFKEFSNITIKYEPRLHAKYYANESAAILSSMNLYDFSQNNNIEFGILTRATLVGKLTGSLLGSPLDKDAFGYFNHVIENSKTLFERVPAYEKRVMGLSKKYTHSDEVDDLSQHLEKKKRTSKTKMVKHTSVLEHEGYCIRTGEKIPFNIERPLSEKAFKSWSKFKDKDYQEKYCHYSGEESNGDTSFSKPILKSNWNNAKERMT